MAWVPRSAVWVMSLARNSLWTTDPVKRLGYVYTSPGHLKLVSDRMDVPGTPIYVDLETLFSTLD